MAHHAVEGQDEAALGVVFCWRAVAAIAAALQVIKLVVREVQHCHLIARFLPARSHALL